MIRLASLAACVLIAACNPSADGDTALAEANASGAAAANAVDNAVNASAAAPLAKDQALALMKQRHDDYEKIGDSMKAIGRELKAEAPNLEVVRTGAATIAGLSPKVRDWFPAGTGPEAGKTHALPAIWEKPEDFAAKAQDFDRAAQAFNAAAQGGDLPAIRSAQAALAKTCKACHDLYREED